MKSIYDLDNKKKDGNIFLRYLGAFSILGAIFIIAIGLCVLIFMFQNSFKDVVVKNKLNSSASWSDFILEFEVDTSSIKNVQSESDANMHNEQRIIKFETDSTTLFNILKEKGYQRDSSNVNEYIDGKRSIFINKIDNIRYVATFVFVG